MAGRAHVFPGKELEKAVPGINTIASAAMAKADHGFDCFSTDRKIRAFLDPFGRKTGAGENYLPFYFVFLQFFVVFNVTNYCLSMTSVEPTLPKKIMPKSLP
jgi:hypothetical protein